MRTITPIIVGYVVALLIKLGFNVTSSGVTTILGPAIASVYYVVVRALETKFPFLGVFLGTRATPTYAPAPAPTPAPAKAPAAKKTAAVKSSTSTSKKSAK